MEDPKWAIDSGKETNMMGHKGRDKPREWIIEQRAEVREPTQGHGFPKKTFSEIGKSKSHQRFPFKICTRSYVPN